jgi:hypothetical protein
LISNANLVRTASKLVYSAIGTAQAQTVNQLITMQKRAVKQALVEAEKLTGLRLSFTIHSETLYSYK